LRKHADYQLVYKRGRKQFAKNIAYFYAVRPEERRSDTAGARVGLTQRESEVLGLIVAGLSNRAIASRLVIGDETVKSHARAIYRKLGVGDRAGAVAAALREGLFR